MTQRNGLKRRRSLLFGPAIMLICHCQSITDHDIRAAVDWMRASDCDTIVTAGKVYHALGKRPECGGCVSLFVATMRDAPGFAVRAACDGSADRAVPAELTGLRRTTARRATHEGRRQGHRVSERSAAV